MNRKMKYVGTKKSDVGHVFGLKIQYWIHNTRTGPISKIFFKNMSKRSNLTASFCPFSQALINVVHPPLFDEFNFCTFIGYLKYCNPIVFRTDTAICIFQVHGRVSAFDGVAGRVHYKIHSRYPIQFHC